MKEFNMSEQWTRWEPIEGLLSTYDIDAVFDTSEGLKVILECSQKKVAVFFKNGAASYIKTDETLRYKKIIELSEKYDGNFYANWTFFKVKNSEYLKWLEEQSCTISQGYDLQHFCFMTDDSILDVATSGEPIVEHIE